MQNKPAFTLVESTSLRKLKTIEFLDILRGGITMYKCNHKKGTSVLNATINPKKPGWAFSELAYTNFKI